MRNLTSILLSVLLTSAILIGCDFIDSNSSVQAVEDPIQVEPTYNGYYATDVDTMGYEDTP